MCLYIGIDVAKQELVIAVGEDTHTVANNPSAILAWLDEHHEGVTCFVYEATGGYERCLAVCLAERGLPGHCVHANHVRAYAKAMGQLAKTDAIDARMIAEFASVKALQPKATVAEHRDLQALVQRREQLHEMVKQERNRLETPANSWLRMQIERSVARMREDIQEVEQAIKEYLQQTEHLAHQVKQWCSIPCVGWVNAITVLAHLPEIFTAEEKALVALVGLAPMNRDSGRSQKPRRIQGGRANIRRVLYMAALSGIRCNSVLQPFYQRLREQGKPYKVAITACMRKLLLIMRSIAIRQTPWQEQCPNAPKMA